MRCLLKSCQTCNGDLILDNQEWQCLQCARYCYPRPALLDIQFELRAQEALSLPGDKLERAPGRRRRRRAPRDINLLIAAKTKSDRRWWLKNGEIIRHLREGRSVAETAALLGRGQRQIRVVRERLKHLGYFQPDGVFD